MWSLLFIVFLILHAAIHVAIWATPKPGDAKMPFDAAHSWLLGNQRALAVALALAAAALLLTAAVGLMAHGEWWRPVAVAGLAVSFVLMVVYFHPWFLFAQALNAALILAIVWLNWPSQAMVGA